MVLSLRFLKCSIFSWLVRIYFSFINFFLLLLLLFLVWLPLAPGLPPSKFHGVNSSSTSLVLKWDAIPASQVAGILTSFYISYRQINTNDNTTYKIAVPITNLTYEITNLRKYTNYSLEIKGATKFPGINTQPIIVSTDEDGESNILVVLIFFQPL